MMLHDDFNKQGFDLFNECNLDFYNNGLEI